MRFLILGLALISLLSGCTRQVSDSSDVRLTFASQGQGTLDADQLTNIIVNVSGPGINPPIYFNWSRHSCQNCPAPSEIVLTVPGGQDRLIQYLGVYETSARAMVFKYGDAKKALSQSVETVEITASTIGSSTLQGRVFGRYLDGAAAGGPTGSLVAQFVPPNGRPPMTLMRSRMYSGWFSLMLLDGDARFNYLLNETPLFTGVNLSSSQFATSTRVARIRIPAYEREREAGSTRELEGESRFIFGFFGPSAASQVACYDISSNQTISNAFLPAPSVANLTWTGTSPTASEAGPESGGEGFDPIGSGSTCHNTGTEFSDHLVFYHDQLKNGHDSVMGAKPPFQVYSQSGSNMQYIEAVPDSGTASVQLNWKYLPGVTSGPMRVAGVTPFRRDGPNVGGDDLYDDGGIACSRLMAKGFYQAGADVLATDGALTGTTTLTGLPDLSNVKIVLCPFFEGGGGRQFLDAGLEVYSGGSFTGPTLGLKIMGSSTSNSRLYGPSISQPITFLKSAVINNYHNFAVSFGHSQFLTASQIQSVQVSTDNGTTWTNVVTSDATFNSVSPSMTVGLIPVTSGNALGMALAGASDTTFKIKTTMTAAAASAMGVMQPSFVSPAITLIGSTTCASPGIVELYDPTISTVVPSNLLDSFFNVTNGTDLEKTMQLRWSGCPSASAVLDYIVLGGGMSPPNCFDHMDLDFDPSNPVVFKISPKDRMGTNCNVTSYAFDFITPSNAGTFKATLAGSSAVFSHSTVASGLRLLASVDDITGLSNERLFVKMALFGELNAVNWNAVKVNMDKKLLGAGAVASNSTAWSYGPNSGNWQSAAPADNRFSGNTISTPQNSAFAPLTASDSSLNGGALVATAVDGRHLIAISEETLDGGSPVMLFDDGTQLTVGYVPSNSGDFNGKSLKMFNMPGSFSLGTGPVLAKVFTFMEQGYSEPRIFVVAAYASNVKYLFGRALGHGADMTIDWATGDNSTSDTVTDVMLAKNGSSTFPYIVSFYGANYVHWGVFPTHTGSAWANGNGGNGTSMFYQGSSGISTTLTDGTLLGLARCGSQFYVVGRNSGGYLSTQNLPLSAGVLPAPLTSIHPASGATKVACIGMTGVSGTYGRVFVSYNTADGTNALHGFEGGLPFCGGSSDQTISGLSALALSPSSGGFQSIMGVDGMNGFLLAYQATGYPTKLTFASLSCSSSALSAPAYLNWGSLATPANQVRGLQSINDGMGMGTARSIGIFGNKSVFYWLSAE